MYKTYLVREGKLLKMPNYNYECQDCNNIFEVTASISEMEKGGFACTKCGSKKTKRLFDGFGLCSGSGNGGTSQKHYSAPT